MNSFERFEEKELPNKECFFSSTKKGKIDDNGEKLDGHINNEEYLSFEKFIDTCLKFYRLDPCHYFSSPRLSCDAMLKMTGVKF